MTKIEAVRQAVMDLQGNVTEARAKIRRAWEFRKDCKGLGDWQREMAMGHVGYNANGAKMAMELIAQVRQEHAGNERAMGMLDIYEEWMHATVADMAEVKAMIEAYKV